MQNSPKNYEEAKEQFETALAKAKKIPGNQSKYMPNTQTPYMTRDGVPHKLKDGVWVPLTRIN